MLLRTIWVVGIVSVLPSVVTAQQLPSPRSPQWYDGHLTLSAGATVFDRSGSGTTGIYALRVDMPLYPAIVLEGDLAYARRSGAHGIGNVFFPGMQVQLQGTSGPFSPYVGLGGGVIIENRTGGRGSGVSFSPSFSTGLRIALTEGAGLRFEGRIHGVGANFSGVYSEFTGGISVAW